MFVALLLVIGEAWSRLHALYQQWPWKLCKLADARIPLEERRQLALDYLSTATDDLDIGFSRRLRPYVGDADSLLPGGRMFHVIDSLTSTKVQNAEIENNFARAAAMRRAGAGFFVLQ